jgi:hypothetical protein
LAGCAIRVTLAVFIIAVTNRVLGKHFFAKKMFYYFKNISGKIYCPILPVAAVITLLSFLLATAITFSFVLFQFLTPFAHRFLPASFCVLLFSLVILFFVSGSVIFYHKKSLN